MSALSGQQAAQLVSRAITGDRSAYQLLVESFTPLVWSICHGAGLDRTDTEDVVQGVWLRVVQNMTSLREPEKFVGWIATITRNECSSVVRRIVRTRSADQTANAEPIAEGPEGAVLAAERARTVREAIASLDDRCRQLLSMLSAVRPVPYDHISDVLDIPVASIGPTRLRCLDKLRRNPSIVSMLER